METQSETAQAAVINAIATPSTEAILSVAQKGLEILLDAPDLVEAIPIANTIFKVARGLYSLRDKLFAVKVAKFLASIHDGTVSEADLKGFVSKLKSEPVYGERFAKVTLSQLEAQNDDFKAVVLAEVLKALALGNITFGSYQALAFAITAVNPLGFKLIMNLSFDPKSGTDPNVGATLVGTGLAGYQTGAFLNNDGRAFLTPLGKMLYEHALRKIDNIPF